MPTKKLTVVESLLNANQAHQTQMVNLNKKVDLLTDQTNHQILRMESLLKAFLGTDFENLPNLNSDSPHPKNQNLAVAEMAPVPPDFPI